MIDDSSVAEGGALRDLFNEDSERPQKPMLKSPQFHEAREQGGEHRRHDCQSASVARRALFARLNGPSGRKRLVDSRLAAAGHGVLQGAGLGSCRRVR